MASAADVRTDPQLLAAMSSANARVGHLLQKLIAATGVGAASPAAESVASAQSPPPSALGHGATHMPPALGHGATRTPPASGLAPDAPMCPYRARGEIHGPSSGEGPWPAATPGARGSIGALARGTSGGLPITSLMVRNIPAHYTQDRLVQEWPVDGTYDFLYLPRDQRRVANMGYAFVNFRSKALALEFRATWQGRCLPGAPSQARLSIIAAEIQGLEANLRQLKKKRVCRIVEREWQPIVLMPQSFQ
eukprot:CAMPEP_0176243908 /NCGR_PEP_ID=MMETSP0121_2-20121125/31162_1 /TAXON_ID=160619 /ORGANISM="Kryptoperidinium foliaceum, Strain CCMP 1326" /LENGTH=248 /DNA_ID=CAMNT_0017583507 /DNA_START=37 /DNA_END=783 /DNA_ORIENTATION=-